MTPLVKVLFRDGVSELGLVQPLLDAVDHVVTFYLALLAHSKSGYIAACDKHVTDFFTDCSPGSVPHPLGDHRIVLHLAQTAVGGITETFGTLQSTLNIKYRSNIGKWGFRLET